MANILISIVAFTVLTILNCAAGTNEVLTVVPTTRELFMKEGDKQILKCTAAVDNKKGYTLNWVSKEKGDLPKSIGQEHKQRIADGKQVFENEISFTKFNGSSQQGVYICILSLNDVEQKSNSIDLIQVKETKIEPMWYYLNATATVSCDIEVGKQFAVDQSPIWYKNGTQVKDLKDKDRFNVYDNNTLTITEPQRTDAGLYTLRFMIGDGDGHPYDCNAAVKAGPFVKDFDKSKNLIQDEDMELRCDVLGYPYAEVTWSKDGVPVNNSKSNPRVKLSTFNNYKNARLTISKVDFDDAGNYECKAFVSSMNATASKDITVRVKDKMAALWPFLGIVAEVIVLCVIIFIYENRRNKQAQQANHNAHEAGGASNDTAEGLRHRNTPANNPRA